MRVIISTYNGKGVANVFLTQDEDNDINVQNEVSLLKGKYGEVAIFVSGSKPVKPVIRQIVIYQAGM